MIAVAELNVWDIITIVAYFILVLGVGLYSMCKSRRDTVSGYFLAGRFMTWFPVGASLFASNIGSDHFIGLAGSGAASGIAVGAYEWNSLIVLQLLAWVFLPVYLASVISTLPEYISLRFGGKRIRMILVFLSIALYIFTKMSVNLYSGALFIQITLGWNLYLSTVVLLILTCICTITGGLTAVIFTETLQFVIMMIGGTLVMVKSYSEIGGFLNLKEKYALAIPNVTLPNTTCGVPRDDAWVMLRDPINSDFPWPGFLIGSIIGSAIWYWCADQMMVQRALAAKSISHAQGGCIFASILKILPLFMVIIPGMISRVLFPDIIACAVPEECEKYCNSRLGCSNYAYPLLVLELLPVGVRGIMIAVMLAGLMADLSAIFNSTSSMISLDIWIHIRPKAGTKELLLVGKLSVLATMAISIAWIPVILNTQGGQLFTYIQSIQSYLTPPIGILYLTAIFWKRLNEKGAFYGLLIGMSVGITRMALDMVYSEPACGEHDSRPPVLAKVHFLYFSIILIAITLISSVVISLFTEPPKPEQLIRTTFWTRHDILRRNDNIEMRVAEEQTNPEVGRDLAGRATKSIPKWKELLLWFWGTQSNSEESNQMKSHLENLSALDQKPWETKLLLTFSIFILILVTVLYLIFTLLTPKL